MKDQFNTVDKIETPKTEAEVKQPETATPVLGR